MARARKGKPKVEPQAAGEAEYGELTHRPLHCLVFLLPLLAVYELGAWAMQAAHPGGPPVKLVAEDLLERFLAACGATAYHLPPLAVVAILLSWQIFSREPWRVHWPTILGMTGESVLLALPLVAMNYVVGYINLGRLAAVADRSGMWFEQLILSVGAGIYEELLFRLMLISVLSFLLVDVLRMPKRYGLAAVIVLSSLAFALQHQAPLGNEPFVPARFSFRLLAGGFLASVFVLRGFAVAVGCHAFYDIIAFTRMMFAG
jgi:membrane protease YdiL (CAAX protease family)